MLDNYPIILTFASKNIHENCHETNPPLHRRDVTPQELRAEVLGLKETGPKKKSDEVFVCISHGEEWMVKSG